MLSSSFQFQVLERWRLKKNKNLFYWKLSKILKAQSSSPGEFHDKDGRKSYCSVGVVDVYLFPSFQLGPFSSLSKTPAIQQTGEKQHEGSIRLVSWKCKQKQRTYPALCDNRPLMLSSYSPPASLPLWNNWGTCWVRSTLSHEKVEREPGKIGKENRNTNCCSYYVSIFTHSCWGLRKHNFAIKVWQKRKRSHLIICQSHIKKSKIGPRTKVQFI